MPRTVLLTLGRLPKALDLARSFHAAGHRTVVADPHQWHLSRLSRAVDRSVRVPAPRSGSTAYLQALLDTVEREEVTDVVPVSEETLHVAALTARLPAHVRLACDRQETLLALHHKQRFIERAQAHGLDVPETVALDDPQASELAAAHDVVVKPTLSCAGHGVELLARGSALPAPTPGRIVQRFVEGDLLSSFTIAHAGKVLVSVVYRGVVMSGTVAVCFERIDGADSVERWIERFVAAEALSGFVGFDFVLDASNRAVAIECNPRVTSGIHFLHEHDLEAAVLRPQDAPRVRFREQRLMQQFWPCLTETQAAMFKRSDFVRRARALIAARDVTWQWRDPLPLLLMPFGSYPILTQSVFKGMSFGEAATHDIEWQAVEDAGS